MITVRGPANVEGTNDAAQLLVLGSSIQILGSQFTVQPRPQTVNRECAGVRERGAVR